MHAERVAVLVLCGAALAARAGDAALAPLSSGETIFVGKLTKVTAGPVGLSNPPVRSYTFEAEPSEVLRGKKPTGALSYLIKSQMPPAFPLDKPWLIAARKVEKGWQVTYIGPADEETVKKAKALAALPAGWKLDGGKPVSPWAALKERRGRKTRRRRPGPRAA
ncbi:MAG: hypothetical protein ACKODX_09050 [Gemmata sp.]